MFEYFPQPITWDGIGEGIIVGIIIIIFAYIGSAILFLFEQKPILPLVCNTWNDTHIMEKSLFLTGFLAYIVMEVFGVNKWYGLYKVQQQ